MGFSNGCFVLAICYFVCSHDISCRRRAKVNSHTNNNELPCCSNIFKCKEYAHQSTSQQDKCTRIYNIRGAYNADLNETLKTFKKICEHQNNSRPLNQMKNLVAYFILSSKSRRIVL